MAVLEQYRGGYYLWKYVPSLAAAIIFAIFFFVIFCFFVRRMIRTRTWFCLAFTIGCLTEFAGYCARGAAHNKTGKLFPYIISNNYIVLSPALMAATIYMTLGRIIRSVAGEHLSIIPVKSLTRTFVLSDILSFAVQGGAIGLIIVGDQKAVIGTYIVIAGFFIQIIGLTTFFISAAVFHRRMMHNPTRKALQNDVPWVQGLHMLYISCALVMVRSVFRVIEYIDGQDGYLLAHEWSLYIFDSLPIAMTTIVFYLRYPDSFSFPNACDTANTTSDHDYAMERLDTEAGLTPEVEVERSWHR